MHSTSPYFETACLSSLAKVFADEDLKDLPFRKASALSNETYSFQVAYRSDKLLMGVRVNVRSELRDAITVRTVGLVPSELPCYEDHDGLVLRSTPGLYPDPLYELDEADGIVAFPQQWRSLWVTVDLGGQVNAGSYPIEMAFETEQGDTLGSETFELEVLPAELPEQQLIHTQWFHSDCLANYYHVEVFSDKHWELIEKFIKAAVDHGINMILTPVFTPPLDTAVGGERPTVQLVDVEKSGSTYRFGFERLKKWVDLCERNGVKYFEFSHLFTQWGAEHAPKIIANADGKQQKIFGWETDAAGEEYRAFLGQFLPELVAFIKDNQLEKRSYFHVSDEPTMAHFEAYRNASEIVRAHLSEFPIIDALSDYSFYEKGLVRQPVAANDHIGPFLEHGVDPLWTYYCCMQYKKVANRFFSFPSSRNRILGMQLYKYNIIGFLQWGYNFWNTQYSKKQINPFLNTDAGHWVPSGDAFLVYPGENGPIESIRMEVTFEALQDLRSLQLLESLIGREQVLQLLEEGLEQPLTFSEYPIDPQWILSKREQINQKIASSV